MSAHAREWARRLAAVCGDASLAGQHLVAEVRRLHEVLRHIHPDVLERLTSPEHVGHVLHMDVTCTTCKGGVEP